MTEPNCRHCKSSEITYRNVIPNRVRLVLIYGTKCGAILAAAINNTSNTNAP